MKRVTKEDVQRVREKATSHANRSSSKPGTGTRKFVKPKPVTFVIGVTNMPCPDNSKSCENCRTLVEPPRLYLPRGVSHVRFYLDSQRQYMRRIDVHKFGQDLIPCLGSMECQVCRQLRTGPRYNPYTWPYRRRTLCISVAFVCSPVKSDLNYFQPVLLLGPDRFGDKLASIVRDLGSDETIQSFFDPWSKQSVVEIYFGRTPSEIEMELSKRSQIYIPLLPKCFRPLSECVIPENQEIDRAQLESFLPKVEAARKKRL